MPSSNTTVCITGPYPKQGQSPILESQSGTLRDEAAKILAPAKAQENIGVKIPGSDLSTL